MEHLLIHAGYGALALFGFLEACCVPIPSELTFLFGGVLAFQGHLNVVLVIVVGSLAELCGSFVSYGVGRLGGRRVVERVGKYLLITKSDVDRAERFFTGRGEYAVAIGRALPVIRAFTPLVAGFVEVTPLRFGILSLIGTTAYATALTLIGYAVGSTWTNVEHIVAVGSYVIVAIVVLLFAAFIVYRLRELRHESAEAKATRAQENADTTVL
jgi:membrane protein DedA with SNARE-associated domain